MQTIEKENTPQGAPEALGGTKAPRKAGSPPTGRKKGKKPKATASRKAAKKASTGGVGDQLVAMMQRAQGAAMPEMTTACGWKSDSVRGFISAVVRGKQGLTVELRPRKDGTRAYYIAAKKGGK